MAVDMGYFIFEFLFCFQFISSQCIFLMSPVCFFFPFFFPLIYLFIGVCCVVEVGVL